MDVCARLLISCSSALTALAMDREEALRLLGYAGTEQPRDEADLKARYQRLVKVWHPDRFAGDAETGSYASAQLAQINAAYKVLRDSIHSPPRTPNASAPSSAQRPSGGPARPAATPGPETRADSAARRGAPPPADRTPNDSVNRGPDKPAPASAAPPVQAKSSVAGTVVAVFFVIVFVASLFAATSTPNESSVSREAQNLQPTIKIQDGDIRLLQDLVEVSVEHRSLCLIHDRRRRAFSMTSTDWVSPPLERGAYALVYRVGAFPPVKWPSIFVEPNKSARLSAPTWTAGSSGWTFSSSQSAETGARTDSVSGNGEVEANDASCESNAVLSFYCNRETGMHASLSLRIVDDYLGVPKVTTLSRAEYDPTLAMMRAAAGLPCEANVSSSIDDSSKLTMCGVQSSSDMNTLVISSAGPLLKRAAEAPDGMLKVFFRLDNQANGSARFTTVGLRDVLAAHGECFRERLKRVRTQ